MNVSVSACFLSVEYDSIHYNDMDTVHLFIAYILFPSLCVQAPTRIIFVRNASWARFRAQLFECDIWLQQH